MLTLQSYEKIRNTKRLYIYTKIPNIILERGAKNLLIKYLMFKKIVLTLYLDQLHVNIQTRSYEMSTNPGPSNKFWVFFQEHFIILFMCI